jgi:hypothetical protein
VSNTAVTPYQASSGLWLYQGPVTIRNSIVAYNGSDGLGNATLGPYASLISSYNLTNGAAPFTGVGDLNNTHPLLGPLQVNFPGSSISTHALLPGSPAINAGNDAFCPLTDARGVPRPIGAHCDIGAFERFNVSRIIYVPFVRR